MEVKLIEIRDRATFIPAFAVRLHARSEAELYLLRRAGYGESNVTGRTPGLGLRCPACNYTIEPDIAEGLVGDPLGPPPVCMSHAHGGEPVAFVQVLGEKYYPVTEPYVILAKIDRVEAHCDPFDWPNQRTMGNAHRHLVEHWQKTATGDVVDVEFVLGEVKAPKRSERR